MWRQIWDFPGSSDSRPRDGSIRIHPTTPRLHSTRTAEKCHEVGINSFLFFSNLFTVLEFASQYYNSFGRPRFGFGQWDDKFGVYEYHSSFQGDGWIPSKCSVGPSAACHCHISKQWSRLYHQVSCRVRVGFDIIRKTIACEILWYLFTLQTIKSLLDWLKHWAMWESNICSSLESLTLADDGDHGCAGSTFFQG